MLTIDSAESSRRLLHERAAEALGAEAAAVLMEHRPPAGWSDLARRSDVEHATALLRGELAVARAETAAEFAAVRQETSGGFADLRQTMTAALAAAGMERVELKAAMSDALTRQTWWMAALYVAFAAILSVVQVIFD